MQQFEIPKPLVSSVIPENSPVPPPASETVESVPDSFAEWLGRPAQTITGRPESAPGAFLNLDGRSKIHLVFNPSRPRR